MKGTLKLELAGGTAEAWDRMRALRDTLPQALNGVMRSVHPSAVRELEAIRDGAAPGKPEQAWRHKLEKLLREQWNAELARELCYQQRLFRNGKRKKEPDPRSYVPVIEPMTAETVDNILSRFTGEHKKALIACRASFPSFRRGCAWQARSRASEVRGAASKAFIGLPLFGTGKKLSEFFAIPTGRSHTAIWNRIVAGEEKREEIVRLEQAIKADRKAKAHATKVGDHKARDAAADAIERNAIALEQLDAYKRGRVGVKFDARSNKWFAHVSWAHYRAPEVSSGKRAALVYGSDQHIVLLPEDGAPLTLSGEDVLATRSRFRARRSAIQRCINSLGKGSRGHGWRRKYAPINRLREKEARFVDTRIRQYAAQIAAYCKDHGIGSVIAVDMSDTRERFEKRTKGEARPEVRRLIHSWPFYEQAVWNKRNLDKVNVGYAEIKPALAYDGCPCCGARGNLDRKEGRRSRFAVVNGERYERRELIHVFKCDECGLNTSRDAADAARLLLEIGAPHKLADIQKEAVRLGKQWVKDATNRILTRMKEAAEPGAAASGSVEDDPAAAE
jgi:hypothetical protein